MRKDLFYEKKKKSKTMLYILLVIGGLVLLSAFLRMPKISSIEDTQAGRTHETISQESIVKDNFIVFFWYGCPHCLTAYTEMIDSGFIQKVADSGMSIRKVPVAFGPTWTLHARMFYAFDKIGMTDAGHIEVMRSIQMSRVNTDEKLKDFVRNLSKRKGSKISDFNYDVDAVISDMYSPRVNRLLKEDAVTVSSAYVTGVPAVLVNGMHRINLSSSVNKKDLPTVAYLLATENKEEGQ